MFRAYFVAVLHFLQMTACFDAQNIEVVRTNYSTELVDIIENFTVSMDLPKEEGSTRHLCELEFSCTFQCNFSLMESLREVHRFHGAAMHEVNQFYLTDILQQLENATELQKYATLLLQNLISEIQEMSVLHTSKNESNCSGKFVDLDQLKNHLVNYTEMYQNMKSELLLLHTKIAIVMCYSMPVLVVWFLCGMTSNGLLLFIFVRHSETRSGPNVLLVNLAVSDTVFLIISVSIEYFRVLWGIPFRTYGCYIYHFLLTCITAVSVYSMTALSFMRYMALTVNNSYKHLLPMPVVLSVVWIMSSLVAIPDTVCTVAVQHTNETFFCTVALYLPNTISNFIFIGFLPLIAIMFFYISASKRLQESICNMRGESMGHENIKAAREKGAKILPAQAFVFAITYLPFYTYWLVQLFISFSDTTTTTIFYIIVYFLFNLNSTLNPIALYLVSSMFRNYLKKYIFLGLLREQTTVENSSRCYVSSTAV